MATMGMGTGKQSCRGGDFALSNPESPIPDPGLSSLHLRVVLRLRLSHKQRQEPGDAVAQLAAVADVVTGVVVEQAFRPLLALRQVLAHGRLDHARAGGTAQGLRPGTVARAGRGETR